jgi:S-adenosyl-l-methionine hydroxide adenosyltransferase
VAAVVVRGRCAMVILGGRGGGSGLSAHRRGVFSSRRHSTFFLVLVHVVADYGPAGDLAFAEVAQRLVAALPGATIVAIPVGPFDTLAAGFVIAQLALTDGPAERVVFHNVAPRRDEASARRANEGERFTAAEAPNGTLVVGPNSGHSLAFLHDQAPLFYLDVPAAGSQFRSRDFLPAAVGRLVAGDRGSICEPVPPELVPGVPRAVVAYADGYGNLKTTLDERPAPNGERVLVRLGEASATAIVSDGSFSVAEGELALAAGSSGWPLRDGTERRFLELFLRGGSASARLGHPASGTPVVVSPTTASA